MKKFYLSFLRVFTLLVMCCMVTSSFSQVKKIKYLGYKYEGEVEKKVPHGNGTINVNGISISGVFNENIVNEVTIENDNYTFNGSVEFVANNVLIYKKGGIMNIKCALKCNEYFINPSSYEDFKLYNYSLERNCNTKYQVQIVLKQDLYAISGLSSTINFDLGDAWPCFKGFKQNGKIMQTGDTWIIRFDDSKFINSDGSSIKLGTAGNDVPTVYIHSNGSSIDSKNNCKVIIDEEAYFSSHQNYLYISPTVHTDAHNICFGYEKEKNYTFNSFKSNLELLKNPIFLARGRDGVINITAEADEKTVRKIFYTDYLPKIKKYITNYDEIKVVRVNGSDFRGLEFDPKDSKAVALTEAQRDAAYKQAKEKRQAAFIKKFAAKYGQKNAKSAIEDGEVFPGMKIEMLREINQEDKSELFVWVYYCEKTSEWSDGTAIYKIKARSRNGLVVRTWNAWTKNGVITEWYK